MQSDGDINMIAPERPLIGGNGIPHEQLGCGEVAPRSQISPENRKQPTGCR